MIAARNGWGAAKTRRLNTLLGYLMAVPIPYGAVMDCYVQIDDYSLANGRQMGKNDLWIAATARATGATLLTTDRNFDHLAPNLDQPDLSKKR